MTDQEYLSTKRSVLSQLAAEQSRHELEKTRLEAEKWRLYDAFTKNWTVMDFWEFRDKNGGQDP